MNEEEVDMEAYWEQFEKEEKKAKARSRHNRFGGFPNPYEEVEEYTAGWD